ncbi:MAG: succinate dehydrogenase [Proteobacteria bacterium]|nr:succinate dehydrogenase [Pseudomonadota bacterium]
MDARVQGGAVVGGRRELWLFVLQRASAALLAPLVLVHLATMIYAIQGGLSAAEILARTRASVAWPLLYALFVAAASVHGAIGLRTIVREMTPWRGASLDAAAVAFALACLALGFRAVGALA